MRPHWPVGPLALVLVVASLATATPSAAQSSFEVVHAFRRGPTFAADTLTEAVDGRFFSTSVAGGAFDQGTVFAIERDPGGSLRITELHSFGGPGDGSKPQTGVIAASDGALYGTTYAGGAHGYGTVFRVTPDGNTTNIHSFDGLTGARPGALMQARDGFLYGVTEAILLPSGALPGTGTIFKISTAGAFTLLHEFVSGGPAVGFELGVEPQGPLVQAPDGTFYGVARAGGSWLDVEFPLGTIFKFSEDGVFTRLHTFGAHGYNSPRAGIILTGDGSLYGVAAEHSVGSVSGPGAIFRRSPDGTVTFIHPFTIEEHPRLHFQHADGTLFGTTDTSVFQVAAAGTLTRVRSFAKVEGLGLRALTQARDGRLYGLAGGGGFTERGTAFAMTYGGVLAALNPFITDDQPMQPVGTLVPGTDGSVFGVSCRGGWLNAGTVYKRSAAGAITTVKSFSVLDGLCPFSLLRGADGFMYGATRFGGLFARGTVFRIGENGSFTLLRMFSGIDGSFPDRLLQTRDGQLWGTTFLGPLQTDAGGVFRISPAGGLGTAFALAPGCYAQLGAQGPDGSIYGTMRVCASDPAGTLFRMSASGAMTTILRVAAEGLPGYRPAPPLLASDGKLYGTVEGQDGFGGRGALFVSTLAGQALLLHNFAAGEGENPVWGLIEGDDGLLYGTTAGTGSFYETLAPSVGTVFSATKTGALRVLHTFSYALTGGRPFGPLMQTPDGAIFGTTVAGGPAGQGVLFRILPGGGSE